MTKDKCEMYIFQSTILLLAADECEWGDERI
jgi:hypothetical protein